jgi:hypothetical protein
MCNSCIKISDPQKKIRKEEMYKRIGAQIQGTRIQFGFGEREKEKKSTDLQEQP